MCSNGRCGRQVVVVGGWHTPTANHMPRQARGGAGASRLYGVRRSGAVNQSYEYGPVKRSESSHHNCPAWKKVVFGVRETGEPAGARCAAGRRRAVVCRHATIHPIQRSGRQRSRWGMRKNWGNVTSTNGAEGGKVGVVGCVGRGSVRWQ